MIDHDARHGDRYERAQFERVINMKPAKALGIKIPDVVLLRADKLIE